ncbi:MAG: flagellar basal body L-ring protein FlgH [Planctomycetes bacterium]|nr:flagellar basal body L-ring protein FlgH [Planctomycetota bacterium]
MKRMIWTTALLSIVPVGMAFGQSSSLYQAARMRVLQPMTGNSTAGGATSQPANTNNVSAATNGALRVSAGSAAVPSAPRNLALLNSSLTAVSPPEPTMVKVNDLIGVIIRHRYRAQTDSRLQQKNEWDVQSKLDAWFRIHDRKWQQQNFGGGKPEVNFQHENEMKNQGRTNRQDVVETRVMAKVIDVKPNGNLIIIGGSTIGTSEDKQIMMLSGEINSKDVLPDRTITSDKIYDLNVDIKNEGAVSDAVKRGWLKEVLDGVKAF